LYHDEYDDSREQAYEGWHYWSEVVH